eukprot:386237-Prorocentrum_minimum.AAC.1
MAAFQEPARLLAKVSFAVHGRLSAKGSKHKGTKSSKEALKALKEALHLPDALAFAAQVQPSPGVDGQKGLRLQFNRINKSNSTSW